MTPADYRTIRTLPLRSILKIDVLLEGALEDSNLEVLMCLAAQRECEKRILEIEHPWWWAGQHCKDASKLKISIADALQLWHDAERGHFLRVIDLCTSVGVKRV